MGKHNQWFFVWIDEYPEEGSMLVRAPDAETAKASSGMGDVQTLLARRVTTGADDVHALLARAAAEGQEWARHLSASIRMQLVGLLCAGLPSAEAGAHEGVDSTTSATSARCAGGGKVLMTIMRWAPHSLAVSVAQRTLQAGQPADDVVAALIDALVDTNRRLVGRIVEMEAARPVAVIPRA